MKPKIFAMYLPQYHSIPENDAFWGNGFTDWVTVRRAKPLFEGHLQPKIPAGNHYYDLSQKESIAWQAKLAREYGIAGFGIYHYWFNDDKNLLTKPAEILLENTDIDIDFFFAWDNTSWRRSWSSLSEGNAWAPTLEQGKRGPATLIQYKLGGERSWRRHYDFLKPFFADSRYVKKDGRPLFVVFYFSDEIVQMSRKWDEWAREDGYKGIFVIYRHQEKYKPFKCSLPTKRFPAFNYEPMFNGWGSLPFGARVVNRIAGLLGKGNDRLRLLDYDKIWLSILKNASRRFSHSNMYHGCYVSYDDTPRRGASRGIVVKGSTPAKFEHYLRKLIDLSQKQGKEFLFVTAWNEWGEGACLEPDQNFGLAYLEAVKRAIG